jgi:serine/threonine protein kinase
MHALRTRSYGKNNPPIQISDDAAESIIQMLSKNPEDRPRVENLMELPIFHNQDSDDD